MTAQNLKLIAESFSKSPNYPLLPINEIRQVIKSTVATNRRAFFSLLNTIQTNSKEESRFVFNVSKFCNTQLHGQEVLN